MENTKIQNFKDLKVWQCNQKLLLIIFFVTLIITVQSPISAHASTIGMSKPGNYLGLVGWWTFDGKDTVWTSSTAATALDKSGNGNTGTLTNMNVSTATVAGKVGQGLRFDGNDDSIDAGSSPVLDDIQNQGGGGMTVTFWIKPDSNTNKIIIAKGSIANNTGFWQLLKSSNTNPARLTFQKDGTTDSSRYSNSVLTSGVWQHIAVTWNGSMAFSTGVNFYKNGVIIATNGGVDGATGNSDAAYDVCMGNASIYASSGCTNTGSSDMSLDDVRIYNRVLSVTEIQQLYNVGK